MEKLKLSSKMSERALLVISFILFPFINKLMFFQDSKHQRPKLDQTRLQVVLNQRRALQHYRSHHKQILLIRLQLQLQMAFTILQDS